MFKKIIALQDEDGKIFYAVRKLSMFRYEYLNREADYWWSSVAMTSHCLFDSWKDARNALKKDSLKGYIRGLKIVPVPETELDKLLEE